MGNNSLKSMIVSRNISAVKAKITVTYVIKSKIIPQETAISRKKQYHFSNLFI